RRSGRTLPRCPRVRRAAAPRHTPRPAREWSAAERQASRPTRPTTRSGSWAGPRLGLLNERHGRGLIVHAVAVTTVGEDGQQQGDDEKQETGDRRQETTRTRRQEPGDRRERIPLTPVS